MSLKTYLPELISSLETFDQRSILFYFIIKIGLYEVFNIYLKQSGYLNELHH